MYHSPDLYFALCPGRKGEFETAQTDPACKAAHTPSLGCDEENLSGRS